MTELEEINSRSWGKGQAGHVISRWKVPWLIYFLVLVKAMVSSVYSQYGLSYFLSASIVFASSFMLHSNLALESGFSGKRMSVTSMEDAPGSSWELDFIFSEACDHLFAYDSGMLHVLFWGSGREGEVLWFLQVVAVANLICGLQLKCS